MPRYGTDNYRDPEVTLDDFGEEIKNELRQEYRHAEAERMFWAEFYSRHPNLRSQREIVQVVYNENLDDLLSMVAGEALETLAELTNQRVNWLDRTRAQREEAAMWSGGPGMEDVPVGEQEIALPGPGSMSSFIKARKEAKREAQHGRNMRTRPRNTPSYGRPQE